jgi:hypothetical protein
LRAIVARDASPPGTATCGSAEPPAVSAGSRGSDAYINMPGGSSSSIATARRLTDTPGSSLEAVLDLLDVLDVLGVDEPVEDPEAPELGLLPAADEPAVVASAWSAFCPCT